MKSGSYTGWIAFGMKAFNRAKLFSLKAENARKREDGREERNGVEVVQKQNY